MHRGESVAVTEGGIKLVEVGRGVTIVQATIRGFCVVNGSLGLNLHLQWRTRKKNSGYGRGDIQISSLHVPKLARAKMQKSFAKTNTLYMVLRGSHRRSTRRWFFGRTPVAVAVGV